MHPTRGEAKMGENGGVCVEEGLWGLQLLWNCIWGLDFPACLRRMQALVMGL